MPYGLASQNKTFYYKSTTPRCSRTAFSSPPSLTEGGQDRPQATALHVHATVKLHGLFSFDRMKELLTVEYISCSFIHQQLFSTYIMVEKSRPFSRSTVRDGAYSGRDTYVD